MMEKRKKTLVKNTAVLGLGNICTKGIMFVMTPILTRWLSTEDYGMFDLLTTYISLIVPLVTLDVGEAAFRFLLDQEDSEKDAIIGNTSRLYLIGIILTGIAVVIVAGVFTETRRYICAFAFLFVGEAIYNYFTMLLRGMKRMDGYALANVIYVVVMAVSSVIFIKILHLALAGIILAYAMGYYASVLYMGMTGKLFGHLFQSKMKWPLIKKLLAFSIPLLPNAVSWWVMNVSDRTIISIFLGTSFNAIYSVACKIPNLAQSLFQFFHLSWIQSASESIADADRDIFYSDVINQVIRLITSLVAGIVALDFIFFDYIFSEEYSVGYFLVPILCIAIVFSMLGQFMGGIYIAQKDTKKNGVTTLIAAGVNVVVHFSLIGLIGIYAAAVSTLVSYFALFCVRAIDIKKSVNLHIEKRNYIAIVFLSYLTVGSYFHLRWLNVLNLMLACLFFIWCNYSLIQKAIRMVIRKSKHAIGRQN